METPIDVTVDVPEEVEQQMSVYAVDKERRDKEFADAAAEEIAARTPPPQEVDDTQDRMAQLAAQAEADRLEAVKARLKVVRAETQLKLQEKRLKELSQQQAYQPAQYVDPRMLVGRAPDEPVTAQDVANLTMQMAAAWGNQLQRQREEIIESLRSQQSIPTIDPDTEAKLVESHPWLEGLDEATRAHAMADLAKTDTRPAPAPAQVQPKPSPIPGPRVEQARARVREVAYVEQSTRGSVAERSNVTPRTVAAQAKVQALKDALSKPGGSEQALRILAELGAGPVDDYDTGRPAAR